MFCMHCGEKLPDHAKFCFKCGEKTEEGGAKAPRHDETRRDENRAAASAAPAAESAPEKAESSVLAKIFAGLDRAVCRSEYFHLAGGNPMLGGYSMAVNGNWVLRHVSHFPDDEFILMDADRQAEIRLDVRPKLRKAEYKNLLGFNTCGVWFLIRSQENDKFFNVKFLCVDVVKNRVYEYPIEHQSGVISDIYVYGNEILYINDTSDDKQFLHHLNAEVSEELFSVQKNEFIFRLSATETRFAWGFISKRDGKENWCWYFFDKATRQRSQINTPRLPDRPWIPLLDIVSVDLVKNTMITTLSQSERERYDAPEGALAVRKIETPVEFRILTYKTDRQPAIWRIPTRSKSFYFDGGVYYSVPDSEELDRFDRFGNRFILGGTGGNGVCQNLLATDKWLYVNYDATDMVRLPKFFSACQESARNNPEAMFIFGKGQDFRM